MEQFENNNNIEQQEPELNILDLIKIALANWYWFVISAVLCVSVAFVYLKWAPKIYTRPNQRRQKRWWFFRVERLRGFGYHDGLSKCRQ